MPETKDKAADEKPAAKKDSKTFDCTSCGGTSNDERVCSACGTMLKV